MESSGIGPAARLHSHGRPPDLDRAGGSGRVEYRSDAKDVSIGGTTMSGREGRQHDRAHSRVGGPGALPALFGLLVLLPLLAVPVALESQQEGVGERIDTPYRWIPRGFRGGLYGGWVATDRGQLNLGPSPSVVFGGRLRARVSTPLSLEANIGYSPSERWVVDPRPESGTGLSAVDTVGLDRVVLQGAMHFALTGARTWHGLQPYVLVGAGLVVGVGEETSEVFESSDLEPFRYEMNSSPAVQAGVGVEWLIGDRFGLGLEVRDHLWQISTPDGFFRSDVLNQIEELGLPAPRDSDWTHNLEFGVTLWHYF